MTMLATDALSIVRYSAMTQLFDGFTRQPLVTEKALFLLDEKPIIPQARAEGVYVFSNLNDNSYMLDIRANTFFGTQLDLSITQQPTLKNTVHMVTLQPAPDYPYPQGVTLLRGQVSAQNSQKMLPNVNIIAEYQTEQAKTLSATTKTASSGRYRGRYALPFKGRLSEETSVKLSYTCTGYQPYEIQIQLQRAVTSLLNVQMQPS